MVAFRILVVDDTPFIRRMLRHILGESEFEVVGEAADAEEAVRKFDELCPDFVLMDIIMPGTSGIEAVRQILAKDPKVRIVMCSALGHESVVGEALAAGASDFIEKPFMPDQVLQTLRNLI